MQTKQLLACASLCLASSLAHSAVLYDVNFPSPPHVDGQPILIDGTPNTPSRQNMGSVQMVSNFAGQPGNWGVFNQPSCGASYDQIEFFLPAGQQKIYLSYDVQTSSLNNSDSAFSISLDSKDYGARSLNFHGGGNDIYLFNVGGKSSRFGYFTDQQLYQITIHGDVAKNLLTIAINGNQVHSSTLGSTTLTGIRMTMSPWTGAADQCSQATAAVSNIKIYEDPADLQGPPPEPMLGLELKLRPGTTDVLPASGGYIRHSRTLFNRSANDLSLSYWITTELPDGTSYPLLSPRTVQVPAGSSFSELKNFLIPAWLPAGGYKARLVVADEASGERIYADLNFSKRAE
ncbi:hypothetical protein HNE05_20070 [Aquipseudomonas campi]|uniref:RbmA-like FnIII domain-containing protein n=1 Tax=Aquipseudomonas campi TaxID=2731681 RepID=A0A6M8FX87_9GAMM|nr:hypothetical protein [Pseudomonas campi]QKE65558.1 hypothetical protein HNE05_20070 [Pseudomonas campi]